MANTTRWWYGGFLVVLILTILLANFFRNQQDSPVDGNEIIANMVPNNDEAIMHEDYENTLRRTMDKLCMPKDGEQRRWCVPFSECSLEVERGISDSQLFSGNICDSRTKLCCPEDNLVEATTDRSASSETPPLVRGQRSLRANEFRMQNDNTTTELAEYTMVTVLRQSQSNAPWTKDDYVSGGSIIHPKVVLTGAHNVYNVKPNDIKCRAGEWDTQTDKEFYRHQERNVKKIVIHEDFYKTSAINNIGLIFLETPFEISLDTPHMGVACIGQALPAPGTKCESMGWGNENFNNPDKYAVTLKKVEVSLASRDTCQNRLSSELKFNSRSLLHHNLICTEEQMETCLEDDGSSLVCRIEDGSALFAIFGITWKVGCGEDGLPGVYVNVADFRPWIVQKVQAQGLDPSSFDCKQ